MEIEDICMIYSSTSDLNFLAWVQNDAKWGGLAPTIEYKVASGNSYIK